MTCKIYVISQPVVNTGELKKFLRDEGIEPSPDFALGRSNAEIGVETAGRLCYMSFNKGRSTWPEYIANIKESKHGSVLEHAVWSFIITGVSRSLTHELVRHRAGWSYSQLSQRYVDESEVQFIPPPALDSDDRVSFHEVTGYLRDIYAKLVSRLVCDRMGDRGSCDRCHTILRNDEQTIVEEKQVKCGCGMVYTIKRDDRKAAREAARCVLPNATETKIYCTANARALRHFFTLRGSLAADREIRNLAIQLYLAISPYALGIFSDISIEESNGSKWLQVKYIGV